MNILILSWRGPKHPLFGGAEVSTHEHAKAWIKAGHNVTLFTSSFSNAKKAEVIDGVKIIRQGNQFPGVQIAAARWYLFSDHESYDIVIDQFHGSPFFTPLYVKAPKVAFIHEVASQIWKHNPLPKPLYYFPTIIGPLLEPLVFRIFYSHIPFFTVSKSTQDDLVKFGLKVKNVTVIYNGVTTLKVQNNKDKRPTVIYLGALAKDKGTEDAILTFGRIKNQIPEALFWIVGKGTPQYIEKLKAISNEQGIARDSIHFWGFVDQKKKFELLRRAHVLVNPSVHEGWGLVNIEANSVGTPAVGFNTAGLRDSIKDGQTGILVEAGNVAKLSEAVLKLLKNAKLRAKMAQEAEKWARNFSWSNAGEQSLRFLKYICERK